MLSHHLLLIACSITLLDRPPPPPSHLYDIEYSLFTPLLYYSIALLLYLSPFTRLYDTELLYYSITRLLYLNTPTHL